MTAPPQRRTPETERDRLVREHQGLVYSRAKRFATLQPIEDLVQEGNMGLLRAIEKFDPSKGKFSTYAVLWIDAFVLRFAKGSRAVHSPTGAKAIVVPVFSLDAPLGEDGDSTYLDALESKEAPIDQALERKQLSEQVQDALVRLGGRLNGLAADIVTERLMRGATLDQVAKRHGVSRERARQVELKTRELLARYLAPIQEATT